MQGSAARWTGDLQFSAAELTLRAANGANAYRPRRRHRTLPGGTHAELHFRLAGVDTPEPARIRLVRNRAGLAAGQRLRALHRRRRIAVQRAGAGP